MHESKFQVWHSVMQQRNIFVILLAFKVSLLFVFFGKGGDWVTLWFAFLIKELGLSVSIMCYYTAVGGIAAEDFSTELSQVLLVIDLLYSPVSIYIYMCVTRVALKVKVSVSAGFSHYIYMISHKSHTSYLDHMIQHLMMESSSKFFLSCDRSSGFFVLLLLFFFFFFQIHIYLFF